jgi:hemerythrin
MNTTKNKCLTYEQSKYYTYLNKEAFLMTYVSWDNSLSVNNKDIDNQHKKLFELINKLHYSLKDGHGDTVLKPVLIELVEYVKVHFSKEEKYLEEQSYSELEKHKQEHKKYINEIKTFLIKYNGKTPLLARELLLFLGKWAREHIKDEDLKYSSSLNEQRSNTDM